jgi:YfiH family protein
MLADDHGPIPLLHFPKLSKLGGLVHAITLRPANMACHLGPDPAGTVRRRQALCRQLGVDFACLTLPEQVHGARLAEIGREDVGAGREGRQDAIAGVDGLVCTLPGVPIMVLSADCALVVVYDPRRAALGVAHASWKGTVGRVTQNVAERMVDQLGCRPADLWAGIGPAAGPLRYQVGEEVRQQARRTLPEADRYFPSIAGGIAFDLWACNRDQLLAAGVPAEQIELAGLCTIADRRFFSYRRDGPDTGRFALIAAIRE